MRRLFLALIALACLAIPAQATVNNSTNKTIVLGNGSQTQFTFNFIGVAAAYISVIFTDSSGNETVLTQGSGTTQYQISLNSAGVGQIWGIGGTVTYNPSGTPIPSGSTLTIYRTLPLTQAINLQSLPSIATLGKGSETGLDTGVMQGQQINEQIGRAITVPIVDATAPLSLPPIAQRANQGMGFDSGGNPIAMAAPSSGMISSAMQPVVDAASIPLGRTALGLGSMALENINSGTCGGSTIQDDGSGNARVVFATASDSTNQSVACTYHMTQRIATGPITYTLPRANTLFNGFSFKVYVSSGLITFTPNANDNFRGVASGTSVVASAGSICALTTDAASSGLWELNCNNAPPTLSASAAANALTITLNGAFVNFRDPMLSSGAPVWAIPTGNLSITVPSTATLGTSSSNVPFRIWVFLAYNSGTPVLGVATCSTTTTIYPCTSWETIQKSGTAITTGSTSAGTLYTTSGVSSDSVRIIGYAEYSSGLATAGTWASGPTTLQLCIPPFTCRRPGDTVQTLYTTANTTRTANTASFTSMTQSMSITPTSTVNLVSVTMTGTYKNSSGTGAVQLGRGGGPTMVGNLFSSPQNTAVGVWLGLIDAPQSASSVTYTLYGKSSAGTVTWLDNSVNQATSTMILQEIMGALPEAANDNGTWSPRLAA